MLLLKPDLAHDVKSRGSEVRSSEMGSEPRRHARDVATTGDATIGSSLAWYRSANEDSTAVLPPDQEFPAGYGAGPTVLTSEEIAADYTS